MSEAGSASRFHERPYDGKSAQIATAGWAQPQYAVAPAMHASHASRGGQPLALNAKTLVSSTGSSVVAHS